MRFAADHNFNETILGGLAERVPGLDVVRLRDVGLARAPDPRVLAWAAAEGRILLTHDVRTMPRHAYDRVRRNQEMPGVVEVSREVAVGRPVEELELFVACSREGEWEGQVVPPRADPDLRAGGGTRSASPTIRVIRGSRIVALAGVRVG